MILEQTKEANVISGGEAGESTKMTLDTDSANILMQMLSKNLYSDAIGSTVRETVTNALDSHRKAGVDEPIVVTLGNNKQGNREFTVEDFGTGLDADDVKNIISKYGKSTKRNTNDQFGMFGLGFKAPLAYSSSFLFICRKDGVERSYMMYEGEDVNTIDLMYEKPTDQKNGVKIIIPIEWSDYNKFLDKCKEQLCYFEKVYFVCDSLDNNFKIIREDKYQYSTLNKDMFLHICLDNVYYPLDFQKLGIESIYCPIALRFSLSDRIFPTPNREAIRYTEEAKETILNRIRDFSETIINKYNDDVTAIDDVEKFLVERSSIATYKIEGKVIDLSQFRPYTDLRPARATLSFGRNQEFCRNISDSYLCTGIRSAGRIYSKSYSNRQDDYRNYDYHDLHNSQKYKDVTYIRIDEKLSGVQIDYLKDTLPAVHFVRITDFTTLRQYKENLNLKRIDKSKWRDTIIDYQEMRKRILDKYIKPLSDFKPTQDWLDKRKANRAVGFRTRVDKFDINPKIITESKIDSPTLMSFDEVKKSPRLSIYGLMEEKDNLMRISHSIKYGVRFSRRIAVYVVCKRDYDRLQKQNFHNWITYEKFMEGETKPFKVFATSVLIGKYIEKNYNLFSQTKTIKTLWGKLGEAMVELQKYTDSNKTSVANEFMESVIEHATTNNLFDPLIMDIFEYVKKNLPSFTFLEKINQDNPKYYIKSELPYKEDTLDLIREILKNRRVRMDLKNYVKVQETVEQVQQAVDQELIDNEIELTEEI
jgi:hypothetical protein